MPNLETHILSQITLVHCRWIIAKDHILGITNSKDEHKYSMFQPWNLPSNKRIFYILGRSNRQNHVCKFYHISII